MENAKPRHLNKSSNLNQCDELSNLLLLTNKTFDINEKCVNQNVNSEALIAQTKFTHEEITQLEWFEIKYNGQREFQNCKKTELQMLENLLRNILLNRLKIVSLSSVDFKFFVPHLVCIRILMRYPPFQEILLSLNGHEKLMNFLQYISQNYLDQGSNTVIDLLRNIISVFHKLSSIKKYHTKLIKLNLNKIVIKFLYAQEAFVLHCTLHILTELSNDAVAVIASSHSVEIIVRIISEYDEQSRIQAANLLQSLCSSKSIREQIMVYDSLPVLLSVLHDSNHSTLLWHIVWILVQMCKDKECASEIRSLGGIPLLLNLLQDDKPLNDSRHELSSANMHEGRTPHFLSKNNEVNESERLSKTDALQPNILKLKCACCTALSELSLEDHNTETIVEANGVYIIAKLILPIPLPNSETSVQLQRNAFRALRFLFSMERNRRLFKCLFSEKMFRKFIDVGHYVRESQKYDILVKELDKLSETEVEQLMEKIEGLNQQKIPSRFIKEYAVIDLLGSGAFGSVYKVKKDSSQTLVALKEVSIFVGGKDSKVNKGKQKKRELDEIIRELNIIREQLRHPNIVRYYRTFQVDDKLYIEMQLIEGASLQEHFMSLKEKGENGMGETRIWKVFIQLCLALRYLHKEKHIVHRDLTPNNIMLGENDHVTVTDFGLAKQKQNESKMNSVVGTLLYACPEIIKNEPYDEKADIWTLGCILYQMATLEPPFPCNNMLSLATKIVEAKYTPIPQSSTNSFSDQINNVISKCLTVIPDDRPDIIGVTSLVALPMLLYTDKIANLYSLSQKRLEKERRRTYKHCQDAKRNKQDYHLLFQASQESKTFQNSQIFSNNGSYKVASSCSSAATSPGSELPHDDGDQHSMTPFPPPNLRVKPNVQNQIPAAPCRALSFDTSVDNWKETPLHRLIHSSRGRPNTAISPATLTISPRKVRQITDPVQQMLHQLHKIILIDQLPPSPQVNYRQRIISRYKRALFSLQSSSVDLKKELKKLSSGADEVIDHCFSLDASALVKKAKAEELSEDLNVNPKNDNIDIKSTLGVGGNDDGITYAQLKSMIEKVLHDCGYYNVSQFQTDAHGNEPVNIHTRFNSVS